MVRITGQRKCSRVTDITGSVANQQGVDVEHRTCEACDKELQIDGVERRPKRYCGQACYRWAKRHPGKKRPTGRTCANCGVDIDHMVITAIHCSKRCGDIKRGLVRAEPLPDRNCLVCDATFTPWIDTQVCCPLTEDDRKKRKGSSWCAGRYARYLERGGPLKGERPRPFDCAECGKHCVQGEGGVSLNARKFCGPACKKAMCKREWVAANRPYRGPCCHVSQAPTARRWAYGPCVECGVIEMRRQTGAGYCSRDCMTRAARRRRRARLRHARVETVNLYELGQRDNWTCGICGEDVDATLEVPELRAPTVDHITPLAKGGNHSYANTQLAHFICNSVKGDTVPDGASPQLTLA